MKEKKFKRQHEAARKDVKRAFGVLKAKWHILHRPMRATSVKKIRMVVYACIIMHNMILKDDGNAIARYIFGILQSSPFSKTLFITSSLMKIRIID